MEKLLVFNADRRAKTISSTDTQLCNDFESRFRSVAHGNPIPARHDQTPTSSSRSLPGGTHGSTDKLLTDKLQLLRTSCTRTSRNLYENKTSHSIRETEQTCTRIVPMVFRTLQL